MYRRTPEIGHGSITFVQHDTAWRITIVDVKQKGPFFHLHFGKFLYTSLPVSIKSFIELTIVREDLLISVIRSFCSCKGWGIVEPVVILYLQARYLYIISISFSSEYSCMYTESLSACHATIFSSCYSAWYHAFSNVYAFVCKITIFFLFFLPFVYLDSSTFI